MMRSVLPDKLEAGRVAKGFYGSDRSFGPVGAFDVAGPCGTMLRIMASDGTLDHAGTPDVRAQGWEHVSVSTQRRCPNWIEMQWVKEQFWGDDELVLQFHVPKSKHINNHPYCLHLWKSPYVLKLPPELLV